MTLDNHHCVQLVPLFEKLAEQDLTKVEKIVEHKKMKLLLALTKNLY